MNDSKQVTFGNKLLSFKHISTLKPHQSDALFKSHSHNTVEIYYFIKGTAKFVIEGSIYTLKPGSMIIAASGQTHHILMDDCPAYERAVIQIDPAALPKQFGNISEYIYNGCNFFKFTKHEQIWFEENCSLITESDTDMRITLLASFLPLLFSMITTKLSSINDSRLEDDIVAKTINYINKNLSTDLSLDSIAASVYFSKAVINRKFREIMGCTVWDYVMRRRIFTARQKIFTDDNITSAFEESGFKDYSSFFRAYKKIIGTSPNKDLKTYKSMKKAD